MDEAFIPCLQTREFINLQAGSEIWQMRQRWQQLHSEKRQVHHQDTQAYHFPHPSAHVIPQNQKAVEGMGWKGKDCWCLLSGCDSPCNSPWMLGDLRESVENTSHIEYKRKMHWSGTSWEIHVGRSPAPFFQSPLTGGEEVWNMRDQGQDVEWKERIELQNFCCPFRSLWVVIRILWRTVLFQPAAGDRSLTRENIQRIYNVQGNALAPCCGLYFWLFGQFLEKLHFLSPLKKIFCCVYLNKINFKKKRTKRK